MWCSKLTYLVFTRLNSQYANNVPFENPITPSVALKAKKMQLDMESRWKRLENTLSKATHTPSKIQCSGCAAPGAQVLFGTRQCTLLRHISETCRGPGSPSIYGWERRPFQLHCRVFWSQSRNLARFWDGILFFVKQVWTRSGGWLADVIDAAMSRW